MDDTYTTIVQIGNLTACATVEGGALVALEAGGEPVGNADVWFEVEALLARPGDEVCEELEDAGYSLAALYGLPDPDLFCAHGVPLVGYCSDCAAAVAVV